MEMLPNVVLSVAALASAGPGQAQNPRPDLVITGITANASSIAVGDSVEYTVTAKNIGLAPCNLIKLRLAFPSALELTSARADSPLSCEFMDCSGGSFYVMWGGQSFSARYTLMAKSPGSHTVSTTIDPDNVCSENKESNNGATAAPLTVTPPPLSPPRLRLTANQPSFRPTRDRPRQIFPLVITNVGEGTAVNFTLQWPVNLGDLGPTLQSVKRGHPAQAVPFDCTPAGTIPAVCTVRMTLQPQQGVQANLRYAACINGVNPEIRVATAGDNTQENHTLRLNDACPRPDLAITALPHRQRRRCRPPRPSRSPSPTTVRGRRPMWRWPGRRPSPISGRRWSRPISGRAQRRAAATAAARVHLRGDGHADALHHPDPAAARTDHPGRRALRDLPRSPHQCHGAGLDGRRDQDGQSGCRPARRLPSMSDGAAGGVSRCGRLGAPEASSCRRPSPRPA